MKTTIILLAALCLFGCSKNKKTTTNPSAYTYAQVLDSMHILEGDVTHLVENNVVVADLIFNRDGSITEITPTPTHKDTINYSPAHSIEHKTPAQLGGNCLCRGQNIVTYQKITESANGHYLHDYLLKGTAKFSNWSPWSNPNVTISTDSATFYIFLQL